MIRIFLADRSPVFIEGMRSIIGSHPDLKVVGESNNAFGAESTKCNFDILVTDIVGRGMNTLWWIKRLASVPKRADTLILSDCENLTHVVQAIKYGAKGFLSKGSSPHKIIAAIRQVAGGKSHFESDIASKLVDETFHSERSRLSHREYDVLLGIGDGKTQTIMAKEFGISIKTVSVYRSRLLDKLGLKSTNELMRYALANDMTSLNNAPKPKLSSQRESPRVDQVAA